MRTTRFEAVANRFRGWIIGLLSCIACLAIATDTRDALADTTNQGVALAEIERVLALSDDAEYGEYLAGECASCHSEHAVEATSPPRIHGRAAVEIAAALLAFRAGLRENSTMAGIAEPLADEEIAALAHYLASLEGV